MDEEIQLDPTTPDGIATVEPTRYIQASWEMITSHFLTRIGDKMWEFIIPLALIAISPHTLLPAALFGVSVTLVRVLFGTTIGKQIDVRERLTMISWGIAGQVVSVTVSSVLLYFLLEMSRDKDIQPNIETNIFYNWKSSLLMVLLLISAAAGSLCANIMDIAIERDWVPTAIPSEQYLTLTNTRMRQVDLLTEIGGPLLAGLVPLIPMVTIHYSFTIISGLNFITFIPQYLLLRHAYDIVKDLQKPKPSPKVTSNPNTCISILSSDWNPIANIYKGWSIFISQRIAPVSIAMVFLWLTILSPHDIVFTAYLNAIGYTSWELGLFRGIGALVGFVGTVGFTFIVRCLGLEMATLGYILEEMVMVVAGAVVFTLVRVLQIDLVEILHYIFLVFLLLSRIGLYGFEVGEISILQQGIPEDVRGRVNSVETSLTSLASLLVFLGGFVFSDPDNFIYLVWASTFFVTCGALTFLGWYLKSVIRSGYEVIM